MADAMHSSAVRRLAQPLSPGVVAEPIVIAHRGATVHAAENSLAAFEAAISAGVDMVELDVRLTADGVLVVHHDSTVRGAPVSRLTMAELRSRHQAVTTLPDAMRLCRGRIAVDVEVKVAGIERRVLEVLRRTAEPESVVVTSLLEPVIAEVKRHEPAAVCGLLLGVHRIGARAFRGRPFAWMARCGADFILPHQLLVPVPGRRARGLLGPARTRRVPVAIWTVNRMDRLRRYFAEEAVTGVITDVPELAIGARLAATGSRRALATTGRRRPPAGVTAAIGRPFRRQVRPEIGE
jgi:glycerophosphoryl diester phosphodiesterase